MEALVDTVYSALVARELDDADLSARKLCRLLGKTTGALYHHFGSLDGLLFEVSQRACASLKDRLESVYAERGDLAEALDSQSEGNGARCAAVAPFGDRSGAGDARTRGG